MKRTLKKYPEGGPVKSKFTITDFNKKYGTNYNTLEEFTTQLPDNETREFFQKIKEEQGTDVQASLLTMQKKYGNPKVTEKTNPLPIWSSGSASYNSLNNTIYTHSNKKKMPELRAMKMKDAYLAELSHSVQNNIKGDLIENYIKEDVPAWLKYTYYSNKNNIKDKLGLELTQKNFNDEALNYPYEKTGTSENEAHRIIEPQLKKEYNKLLNQPRQKFENVCTINNMKKRSLKKYNGGGLTKLVNPDGSTALGGQVAGNLAMGLAGGIGQDGEMAGQSIGSGIGAAAGQALNAVVPGLGLIAGPILSKLGGMAGKGIGDILDKSDDRAEQKQKQMEGFNTANDARLTQERGFSNNFKTSNNIVFAKGGIVIDGDEMNPTAELELNEQFQLPDGQVGEVEGPSHAEGGIEANLPEGTRIFSDRLKHNGRTFAKTVKPINNKIAKLEKHLETNPNDKLKQNSIMLMNQQLDHYFNVQETNKQNIEMKKSLKYAKGGTVSKYRLGGDIDDDLIEEPVRKSTMFNTIDNKQITNLPVNNRSLSVEPLTTVVPPKYALAKYQPEEPTTSEKFENFISNNAGEIGQVGSALITTGIQNRNINKLQKPRTLGKVNLSNKVANPNLVDYSAERNAIDQGYLASADSAQRNLSNSATAQAFKNQANLARLQGTGRSFQNQENTNVGIKNQFLAQKTQAQMQEELANNEIDKYNNENIFGFDQNKVGMKNQLVAQLGNTAGQVFGNKTKYDNQLEQANILANQYDPSVLNDMIKNGKFKIVDGKVVKMSYGGVVGKRSFKK